LAPIHRLPFGRLIWSFNLYQNWLGHSLSLEESVDFATLDKENLFSKLKSQELSRKGRPNHDSSLTSKSLITCTHVSGHDANPTSTVSSALEFALSFLAVASDEQYESIPDGEITPLARKFHALYKFYKERRRTPRGCFECGDTTTSSPTAPRGRSSTPPTSMTTPTGMTIARATTRRRTALRTRRKEEVLEDYVPSMCCLERL
jgi:hypothetical protein